MALADLIRQCQLDFFWKLPIHLYHISNNSNDNCHLYNLATYKQEKNKPKHGSLAS